MPTSFDRERPRFDSGELDEMLARALARSAGLSARRRRRRSVVGGVGVGLAVAVLVATVAVEGPARNAPARSTQAPPGRVGRGSVAARWKLVADVSAGWQLVMGPDGGIGFPPVELTCSSTTTCYALLVRPGAPPRPKGSPASPPTVQIATTTDGGESWTPVTLPVSVWQARLSCVSASTCALLGLDSTGAPVFLETSDGGETWSSQTAPAALASASTITALNCVSAEDCTAVLTTSGAVGFSLATSDGGQTWTRATLPGVLVPSGLTCTDAGHCVVTGAASPIQGDGAAAYSTDGGATWTAATLPAGTNGLQSVACSGSGFCITSSPGGPSAAETVLTSSDDGATWADLSATGLPSTIPSATDLSRSGGLSCPTTADCWISAVLPPQSTSRPANLGAAQGLLAQSTDAGHTWQPAQLPSTVRAVVGLACPTETTCYAMAIVGTGSGPAFALLSDNT